MLAAAVDLLAEEGAAGLTARSLAARAETSAPALYELFGDKSGVVRELYFEGFRRLGASWRRRPRPPTRWPTCGRSPPPIAASSGRNRELAEVMFSRPFTDFSPGPEELAATGSVRILIVGRVRRCIEAGRLRGDETDVAHVLRGADSGHGVRRGGGPARDLDRVGGAPLAAGHRHRVERVRRLSAA